MTGEASILDRASHIQASLAKIEKNVSSLAAEQQKMHNLMKSLSEIHIELFNTCRGKEPLENTLQLSSSIPAWAPSQPANDFQDYVKGVNAVEATQCIDASLDPAWPVSLNLQPALESLATDGSHVWSRMQTSGLSFVGESESAISHERGHRFIIMPDARLRTVIDAVGVLALMWDLVFTPFQLAWNLVMEGWLFITSLVVTAFWTIDIFANFRSGYYTRSGDVETMPLKVAARYLRRQFPLDFGIVVCDWLSLFGGILPSGLSLVRVLKLTRLVRIVRLLSLIRVERLETMANMLGIGPAIETLRALVVVAWLTHNISCAWFAVGNFASSDTGMRWIDSTWGDNTPRFIDATRGYQYCSALQWTLTTMVSGTSVIIPLNSSEHVFSCVCIFGGLLLQAFVVSLLSSLAVEQNERQRSLKSATNSLKLFCSKHKVSVGLWTLARWQVKEAYAGIEDPPLERVQAESLQTISSKVRMKILYEVFQPHLSRHALFFLWSRVDRLSYYRLTKDFMDVKYVLPGHDIFIAGDQASLLYLISSGKAKYSQDPMSSKALSHESMEVMLDTWICEPALWMQWLHVGTLESSDLDCELHTLLVEGFLQTLEYTTPKLKCMLKPYAIQYHERVKDSVPPQAPWPNDLEILGTGFFQLLTALPETVQKIATSLALEYATIAGLIDDGQSALLAKEFEQNNVNLAIVSTGSSLSLQRVVSVARVILSRNDQRLFVELGTWSEDAFALKMQYPGSKQRGSENVFTTVSRTVEPLKQALGDVVLIATDTIDELQESQKLRLITHYSVFLAFYSISEASSSHQSVASDLSSDSDNASKRRQRLAGLLSNSRNQKHAAVPSFRNSHHDDDDLKNRLEARLLSHTELFLIPKSNAIDSKADVYMWLSYDEISFLKSRKGSEFLQGVLENQDIFKAANLSVPQTDGVPTPRRSISRPSWACGDALTCADSAPNSLRICDAA